MRVTTRTRRFRAPKVSKLFDAVGKQRLGRSLCFLCGRKLTAHNRSDEHVFPKWLQDRYKLWDKTLRLLNDTTIPYRALKIPCCRSCNSQHLSRLENAMKQAVAEGPAAVRRLPRRTLFLWLSKVLYGILFKEGLLRFDQTNPESGRLLPRPALMALRNHHYFLQSARIPMHFVNFSPASIFVFRLQKSRNPQFHFNFRDMPGVLGISMQMGSIGIVGILQDGGTQEKGFTEYLKRFRKYPLHPLQFLELVAMMFYKATLFNRIPKYLTMESVDALKVTQLPLQGFSGKPLFDDWIPEVYARVLSFHTGQPLEQTFQPPDKWMTWLGGPDGEPRFIDIKQVPWP